MMEEMQVKFQALPPQPDPSQSMQQPNQFMQMMAQPGKASPRKPPEYKDCHLLPNDQKLIFMSRIDQDSYKIDVSISYKNIIEISAQESSKFAQISPKQLQIKYIKDFD